MEEIPYFSPTLLLDDLAPEAWIFLDYDDDGRVQVLTPKQYEAAIVLILKTRAVEQRCTSII